MQHSSRFEQLCAAARAHVEEITIEELQRWRDERIPFELIDVREESEFAGGFIPGARHLGRGVLERDIEKAVADLEATVVLYCGGGYRSALAAESLQKMGYRKVLSLAGGWRAWREQGLPTQR